ncbi:MAG: MarR family winged helix-turn-helix transcriptional regulator [Pseudobdellovibrionaceae bacterium]
MGEEFLAVSHLISIARTVQELNFRFEKKYDLSLAQWLVLSHLRNLPGCSALHLSDALSVHPSSLTPALKRLKRKGLLKVSDDPRDSRRKNLWLTREGAKQMESLTPSIRTLFKEINLESMRKMDHLLNQKEQL